MTPENTCPSLRLFEQAACTLCCLAGGLNKTSSRKRAMQGRHASPHVLSRLAGLKRVYRLQRLVF